MALPTNIDDEYILKDVTRIWLSDECITPNNLPRITQPSYGKYLIRADGRSDFCNRDLTVHPTILNIWTKKARGFWVDKPGTNDYYVHEIFNKYAMKYDFNPRNMASKKLFPRPYSCEYDCVNERRLHGMADIEARYKVQDSSKKNLKSKDHAFTCKEPAPFWWKEDESTISHESQKLAQQKRVKEIDPDEKYQRRRWKPVADILGGEKRTCCQRRIGMIQVGQPFKQEACRFYYENYPAPKLEIFPQKFCP